jgi:acetyl-CoA acyltransferase
MSRSAVVVDAVRSPVARGKMGGALSDLHPVGLLSQTLGALMSRTGVNPEDVEDVLIGCVSQVGEQAGNPGRWAWLAAGLPESTPALTVDRRCGSGLQALQFAAQAVLSGAQEVVVAGGVEMMSRVPIESNRIGKDPFGPAADRYEPGLVGQGVAAELMAARWNLTRTDLDEYSARSHQRACEASENGHFDAEIEPVADPAGGVVETDSTLRPGTTVEGLSGLEPAFENAEVLDRFPEINWSVTAGNSSQLADGASALLVVSEEYANRHNLTPLARWVDGVVTAEDPILMLAAPIEATRRVLRRTGLELDSFSHYEVNEAFAPVPLAWAAEVGADIDRLNPRGGAIALGHPLGASGARLVTTALHATKPGERSLVTMCEAGGMANACIFERL